jgi:hypothetical protein
LDAYGFGGFGAPREHRGREVKHQGIDFITIPGDRCVAPITGIYSHTGPVYTFDPSLRSLHIRGTGDFYPYQVVLYYVKPSPDLVIGAAVTQMDDIGGAQDVAGMWDARVKRLDEEWARRIVKSGRKMTNHIHFELRMPDGQRLNPTAYLIPMGSC